ncbi:GDSL-type esterase/lipase family protein [Chitinophaga defluvii]|uniref:GDSL-type esterase/lipase family protein n=1 Tax=Chitinophaga defluvii TaxID=3163343 RepID=A0ABV2T6C5_9BACT
MNIGRWDNHKAKYIWSIVILLMSSTGSFAQKALPGRNHIQQDTALYHFFGQLDKADSTVVSILHLGDSHVQAGVFPGTTGTYLQQDFGNAGRGWVFPYNLGNTNGPADYRWNSATRWQAARIVDRYKSDLLGPGAIVITSSYASPALAYMDKSEDSSDNDVLQAQLLYDAGTDNCTVTAPDATVTITGNPFPEATSTLKMATLDFAQPSRSFQVRWEGKGPAPFRFYGAVLKNGHPGVLYHAVGINGAQYMHYNEQSSTLSAQMAVLQPQLVIISLGTNEAYGAFDATRFKEEIDRTVELLRSRNPEVAILLTTPPNCMRVTRHAQRKKVGKKYKTYYRTAYYPNATIVAVTQQIKSYAQENGLACWDFNAVNKALSGEFASGWANDRIHFNTRGYQLQGKLLYEALQQSYQQYQKETKKNLTVEDVRL